VEQLSVCPCVEVPQRKLIPDQQVTEAMLSEQKCFLDTDEWRRIPEGLIEFPLLPKSPGLHHTFFAHLSAVPGIVHDAKQLSGESSEYNRQSVLSRAQALRKGFEQWYNEYTAEDGGWRKPAAVRPTTNIESEPFDFVYTYGDIPSTTVIVTYYAYLIMLNRAIDYLETGKNFEEENAELAKAICQSVQSCYLAGHCGLQTLRITLPVARKTLPEQYQEWVDTWIMTITNDMDAASG
jgi:hypothetical protein